MKGKIILVCTVTLLIFLSMPNVIAQGIPSPPCVFYGYVNVGGKPAPDGLNVTAVISGTTLKWTTMTAGGTYGWPLKGSSKFEIPSQNTSATEKDGGGTGDTIIFYVQGNRATQTGTFESSGAKQVDLSISNIPGEPEPANPYPLYAVMIVIALAIGVTAALLIHRKAHRRHRTKVMKPE